MLITFLPAELDDALPWRPRQHSLPGRSLVYSGTSPPPTNLIAFCSLSHNHLVYRPSFTLVSLLITFTISHCQDLLSPYQHNSTFFKRVTAALLGHSNDSAVTSSPAQNRQTDERKHNKGTAIRGNYQTSITYASLTSYTQNRNMGETIKEFAIYAKLFRRDGLHRRILFIEITPIMH